MFTGIPQKNRAVAKGYFDEHLSHNDYYTQGELEPGRWIGLGAERLGLLEGQAVDRKAFMELCDNLDPATGRRLTQRHNGEGNRRVFFDFTCSAPKSVSILAVTMDDERIVRAHQQAARIAAKELEQFAATRIRTQGAQEDRKTGNLVGAEFLHNSSRALDPQLHTHFTFFNATHDGHEQRWKALQTSAMFAASQYGTEVYRNELARKLNAIGYEVVATKKGFEIKGVPASLIKRFSKRSAERDKVIAEMERKLGRQLTRNEVSVAVHRTRSRKLKGVSTEEVRERQLKQLSPQEAAALRSLKERASGFRIDPATKVDETAALSLASAHVFERSSVVSQEELLRHALIAGRGQADLAALKQTVAASPDFLRVGGDISTREILGTELYLIQTLNAGQGTRSALAPGFEPAASLGEDQRHALCHVLKSPDQFTGMRGLAGTGKTTTLSELSRALDASSHAGLFCAPTASATEVLRKDGFSAAVTLARLLHDPQQQDQLHAGSVVVLDEAGLVGTNEMKQLFELVQRTHARVIFSGDTGQHASVTRGDALRLLEEHSHYSFRELSRIRRQQADAYREVVELAAHHQPQEAFDRLDQLGWIVEPDNLYETAATAYLESRTHGKPALLVAPTWNEIELVTNAVRSRLKKEGVLDTDEERISIFDSLSWTEAQKQQVGLYSSGQQIVFGRASGAFRHNEKVEVVAVESGALRVRRDDGSVRVFRPRSGSSFDVGEARDIAVASGDLILLQANRVKNGLINGQVGTVQSIRNGTITLTDGRVLPADYRQFSHGYCVTSHAAQARTVDAVFVVASSRSAGAIHREQFYVSISRGRQECRIFTDDKLLVRDRVARSTQRQAALELVGKALAAQGLISIPATPHVISKPRQTLKQRRSLRPSMRPLFNLERRARRLVRERFPLHQRMAALSRSVMQTMHSWAKQFRSLAPRLAPLPSLPSEVVLRRWPQPVPGLTRAHSIPEPQQHYHDRSLGGR
jgi:conjugative relaxase-like TrwC/TraI family protein